MGSRTWVKIYCDKWLEGTLRDETPEFRGVWTDVLALAGSGRYADAGLIALANDVGYTDQQIASILHIPIETWEVCKARLISTERIALNGNNIIHILNWQKYQSEYRRQKPYRDSEKLQPEVTNGSDDAPLPEAVTRSRNAEKGERDREGDRDNIDTLLDINSLDVVPNIQDKARENVTRACFRNLCMAYPKKAKLRFAWVPFHSLMVSGVFTPEFVDGPLLRAIEKLKQTDQWRRKKGCMIPKLEDFLDHDRWKEEMAKVAEEDGEWLVR